MKTLALILLAIFTLIAVLFIILMLGTSHNRTELEKIFRHNIRS